MIVRRSEAQPAGERDNFAAGIAKAAHRVAGGDDVFIAQPRIALQHNFRVVAFAFFDRHLETVARRMARAVVGDLQFVIASYRQFPDAEWSLSEDKITPLADLYDRLLPSDPKVACRLERRQPRGRRRRRE